MDSQWTPNEFSLDSQCEIFIYLFAKISIVLSFLCKIRVDVVDVFHLIVVAISAIYSLTNV